MLLVGVGLGREDDGGEVDGGLPGEESLILTVSEGDSFVGVVLGLT